MTKPLRAAPATKYAGRRNIYLQRLDSPPFMTHGTDSPREQSMKPLLALILGSLLAAAPTMPGAAAAADDAVLGTWLTHEENAHVEISRCEEETF